MARLEPEKTDKENIMAQIRHIAIACEHPDAIAVATTKAGGGRTGKQHLK
jgi:hypothetical protein